MLKTRHKPQVVVGLPYRYVPNVFKECIPVLKGKIAI